MFVFVLNPMPHQFLLNSDWCPNSEVPPSRSLSVARDLQTNRFSRRPQSALRYWASPRLLCLSAIRKGF
jgi:hypothetical protein